MAAIDETLLEQLAERPPHALHERQVEGVVVELEVDPAAHALDTPFGGVAHKDGAAPGVVLQVVDTYCYDILAIGDSGFFCRLALDITRVDSLSLGVCIGAKCRGCGARLRLCDLTPETRLGGLSTYTLPLSCLRVLSISATLCGYNTSYIHEQRSLDALRRLPRPHFTQQMRHRGVQGFPMQSRFPSYMR